MPPDDQAEWEFTTDRLRVVSWRSQGDPLLAEFLVTALTPAVTRELPPTWQVPLTHDTIFDWITARDQQGQLYLVQARGRPSPIGLFMFFRGIAVVPSEVRLGYVLAEAVWGQGYASELVRGFVELWQARGDPFVLRAVVTRSNRASQRVLEKNGFVAQDEQGDLIEYERKRPGAG